KDVAAKNNVSTVSYIAKGSTPLSQMLDILSFGGYLTLYLAFLYGLDPSLIPWVDYFKQELAKSS
ncbi:MAG TPA: SIS domain-containing protein, partial [Candidatus Saccharimonadales bacterium]|nr:SIS domain-containing protein [Candidatus Saccharimonadales bacterium]